MSLRNDIETLRDGTLAALAAAHDHFTYTKQIWKILAFDVRRRGRHVRLNNKITGTVLDERDLPSVAQTAANDYLPTAAVQQFASLTETFLVDLVRLWLTAHPAHLTGQVDVRAIIAAPDKAAILRPLIDQYVIAMSYKRPTDWFKQLSSIVSLKHPGEAIIVQFAEIKATRDIFVHNRGVANGMYVEKAGMLARAASGQPLDLPDKYLHDSWRLCRQLVKDVGDDAADRA